MAFHFHSRQAWETAVRLRLIVPDSVRLEKGREKLDCSVPARSLSGTRPFASLVVDPSGSRIRLVIADPGTAVGLPSVADLGPVAVALVVAGSADFACSSAAAVATVRGVVLVASCSSALRSSSLRNRNFLSRLCFAVPPSASARNDQAHLSNR